MVGNKQLGERRILHFKPFIDGLIALGFDDPNTAVVTLDQGPAGVRSPEPAAGPVVVVEPCEHGFLDAVDGQPLDCLATEEINSPQVVKLHGQVHVAWLMNHIRACHMSRANR